MPSEIWLRFLRQGQEALGVALPHLLGLVRLFDSRGRVLADRLEHPKAFVGVAEEALVDERLEEVEVGVGDFFGRFERAATREDGEPGEELPLFRREEVVAPLDRRSECLLPRVGVTSSLEQVEAPGESFEDLGRREHARAGGGELY